MILTREMGTVLPDTTMSSPVYMDVKQAPFKVYGFSEPFRRLPADVAEATSQNVARISRMATGGRIRFCTNSDFIVVHGDYDLAETSPHINTGAARGFDIYFTQNGKQRFQGIISGSQGEGKNYVEGRVRFDDDMKEVTIYLPILTSYKNIYIGLREGCELSEAGEYKYEKPVVFYGSSIVHGYGVSRAGMIYTNVLSRRLDTNYINLGFGGAAKAEKAIMEYIAGFDMSVFVYDYDHNAPTPEYLEQTHYAGYKIFREKHPTTPVIFATKVDYGIETKIFGDLTMHDMRECRKIIKANYARAKAEGDENVYLVDGSEIFPDDLRDDCTVDTCHPNDLGYQCMADAFEKIIRPILEK